MPVVLTACPGAGRGAGATVGAARDSMRRFCGTVTGIRAGRVICAGCGAGCMRGAGCGGVGALERTLGTGGGAMRIS